MRKAADRVSTESQVWLPLPFRDRVVEIVGFGSHGRLLSGMTHWVRGAEYIRVCDPCRDYAHGARDRRHDERRLALGRDDDDDAVDTSAPRYSPQRARNAIAGSETRASWPSGRRMSSSSCPRWRSGQCEPRGEGMHRHRRRLDKRGRGPGRGPGRGCRGWPGVGALPRVAGGSGGCRVRGRPAPGGGWGSSGLPRCEILGGCLAALARLRCPS